jgi:predicted O-methyltransferase YrrM
MNDTPDPDPLTVALVDAVLRHHVDVADIEDPVQFLGFLTELLTTSKAHVKRVKWADGADTASHKRFERLADLVSAGLPPLDVRSALQVLGISNGFMKETELLPRYGFDVREHFHISSSFGAKGKLLRQAIRYARPETCVEVGTAYGMSAAFCVQALARYAKSGQLWTIEAAKAQFDLSRRMLAENFGPQVHSVLGMSNDVLPGVLAEIDALDFYFHDGGHNFENITSNFDLVRPRLSNGAVVIIDDIRWWDKRIVSEDPRCYLAWEQVYGHDAVDCAFEVNGAIGVALVST